MFNFGAPIICVTTADVHQPLAQELNFSAPGKLTMDKAKKINVSEENRTLNDTWVDSFAFTADKTGTSMFSA